MKHAADQRNQNESSAFQPKAFTSPVWESQRFVRFRPARSAQSNPAWTRRNLGTSTSFAQAYNVSTSATANSSIMANCRSAMRRKYQPPAGAGTKRQKTKEQLRTIPTRLHWSKRNSPTRILDRAARRSSSTAAAESAKVGTSTVQRPQVEHQTRSFGCHGRSVITSDPATNAKKTGSSRQSFNHPSLQVQIPSPAAYTISGPFIGSSVNQVEDASVNMLPALLFTALFAQAPSDSWLRSLQVEQDRIRATQEKHSSQISVNTERLDRIESQGSPNLGKLSEHVNEIQAELDRHEAEDKATKEAETRDHEETMHWIDVGTSAIFTAALAVFGNMFYGWWKEKHHAAQIASIRDIQQSDHVSAEEILKVTKDLAVEVRRNDAFAVAGSARDDKIKSQGEHIQGLEDREASHE